MSKPKEKKAKDHQKKTKETSGESKAPRRDGTRETIESVIVALILAFLFRTFEAEAFVIPTGSMAPTLMGRHKEVECSQCGYRFSVGASHEVDDASEYYKSRMQTAVCPNCRYEMPHEIIRDLPVFTGDRILVNKFTFEFGDPKRFDVVVFKFPEDPKKNYIKRLVGLPGEVIKLQQGDIYSLEDETEKWKLQRKDDPDKQAQLQILVYNNDYPETLLHELDWPQRWAAMKEEDSQKEIAGWSDDANGFKADSEERAFHLDLDRTSDGKYRWLRYRHFVPDKKVWESALVGLRPAMPQPRLITDFCNYNQATFNRVRIDDKGVIKDDFSDSTRGANIANVDGVYWVGDLTVTFRVDVQEIAEEVESRLLIELNEGPRRYRCRIDLQTGLATLFYLESLFDPSVPEERILAEAETPVHGKGVHTLKFANVDDRLCLWVDSDVIQFREPSERDQARPRDYAEPNEYSPPAHFKPVLPERRDLTPVGIAARGAAVVVSKLLLERDIYYQGAYDEPDPSPNPRSPFPDSDEHRSNNIRETTASSATLRRLVSNPREWGKEYKEGVQKAQDYIDESSYYREHDIRPDEFQLGPDEFFMMGDNSPSSKDSRLWGNTRVAKHRYAVPRSALVGKAFFVYWPHGVPFLNDGKGYAVKIPLIGKYFHHKWALIETFQEEEGGPIQTRLKSTEPTDYPWLRVPFYPNVGRMHRVR